MLSRLTIIQVVRDLDRRSGGPSVSVPQLSAALSEHPAVERVVLCARPTDDPAPIQETEALSVRWMNDGLRSVESVVSEFAENGRARVIIHTNGLWNPLLHAAAILARRKGFPLVISPRGMLEPAAFRHKRWKKRFGWWLYQRGNLVRAAGIHSTSLEEAAHLKARGLSPKKIFTIPNGIHIPRAPNGERGSSGESHPRRLLFLGRLHSIKGLEALLDAWARARPASWVLQLTGPDEDGYRDVLQRKILSLGIGDTVSITGPVQGEEKWKLLQCETGCLILPSHSENFGIVVAEALAAGVPVAASTGTPWEGLLRENAGWRFDPAAESIVECLRSLEATPGAELSAMGRRGRAWMERDFAWPAIVERYVEAYSNCL